MTTRVDHLASGQADPTLAAITIMGSGRIGPTITALLGLTAAALAARALVRARRGDDRTASPAASKPLGFLLGLAAILLGGMFLSAADGGPGTGNGVVGSGAAIVLGVFAVVVDRVAATQRST